MVISRLEILVHLLKEFYQYVNLDNNIFRVFGKFLDIKQSEN